MNHSRNETGKPFTNLTSNQAKRNINPSQNSVNKPQLKSKPNPIPTHSKNKKSKSFINNNKENDILSNPFQKSLNITPKPSKPGQLSPIDPNINITNNPNPKSAPFSSRSRSRSGSQSEEDEDDDLRKPLSFNTNTINIPSPQPSPQRTKTKSNTNTNTSSNTSSIINTPKMNTHKTKPCHRSQSQTPSQSYSTSQSQSPTPSICGSVSLSPGVIKSRKNIPSPQRIPSISLRSFHTINHVEFYKPIPISQSRSTQFEIKNETYDHKSIQIKKKHVNNYNTHNLCPSCITISPTAVDLKRYDSCLITVTCRPLQAMRIKEIFRIEWDLHSIEVQIHAVGFQKSLSRKNKERGYRKRSLQSMRKEDEDKCQSVESSMESSSYSSNSSTQQNRYFFFVFLGNGENMKYK